MKIQDKIFDLYFTNKKGGSGIGLNTCKNVIENMNGYIGFKSKFNEGSDFYFLLPICEPDNFFNCNN